MFSKSDKIENYKKKNFSKSKINEELKEYSILNIYYMKQNMNKLSPILLLFIATVSLKAQNGYIKFNKDKELDGKKFFKDEIYPILKETKEKLPFYFIAGIDTLNVGKSVDKLEAKPDDKTLLKDNFIKLTDGGLIHVDISSISKNNDRIRLVSEKFEVIPIVKNITKDFEATKIGKSFHLIIPNSPTIYYSFEELTKINTVSKNSGRVIVIDDKSPQKKGEPENETYLKKIKSRALPQIIPFSVLGLGIIGFGIWLFFRRKNSQIPSDKEPIFMTYNNDKSLSTFAMDNNINLGKLIHYNKGLIDKKYVRFNYKERKDVQNSLKNRKLIVGFQEMGASNSNNNFAESEPLADVADNLNDLNNLKNEKTEIESRLSEFETQKIKLDITLSQLQKEKVAFENKLLTAMAESDHVQNELNELKKNLLKINF